MVEFAPTRKNWKDAQPNPLRVLFPEVSAWVEGGAHLRTLWIDIGLVLMALLVYAPSVWHDFVALADYDYVRDNPHVVSGFTLENIWWALRTNHTGLWQPLTWLSHMRDCQFHQLNPAWQHFSNILLHTVNAALLFFVLVWFTGERWRGAFVAALFAVHPLNVESVAWIAERKDLLATFFFLLTFLAYGQYLERRGVAPYLFFLLVFALGLMASPVIIALPLVLLLVDYWPLRYFEMEISWRRILYEKLPLIALSLIGAVVTFFMHKTAGALSIFDAVPRILRAENALCSYARYLGKIFWPANLIVPYRFDETYSVAALSIAAGILVVTSVVVIFCRRAKPYLITGWLWYLITLLPVLGLIQIGPQAMANRYTYIPAIGIFIAGTWLGADLLARWPLHRPIIIAACVLILSACVIKTSFQLPHWENSETLLKHAVALDPKNYLALEALADEFGQQKKTNDQMDCYERVLKIKPDRPFARANAGLILSLSGHPKQAAVQYQMAMQSILAAKFALTTSERQRASDIANNLAWIRATSLDPNLRNTTDALELAQHSIEWTGGTGDAVQLDTLAAAQAQAGKFDSAVTTARRALDLAKTTRQPQLVSQIERHISLYEMEQPFREFPE